jgi:threonine synthase
VNFISTRNKHKTVSGAAAIAEGLAPDGGLYVPESFPAVSLSEIAALIGMDYPARAADIIGRFLPDCPPAVLLGMAEEAYARFDGDPAPLVKTEAGVYVLELWHGPTGAFKDIALTLLPRLLTQSKALLKKTEKTLILVATSGDTGKAALEGFRDVPGADILVLYPDEGVSALQKRQMTTQEGGNVAVAAVRGNFDDAQTAVKRIFTDPDMIAGLKRYGYALSSANSINFGRLVPQIVYYFSAYADLLDEKQIRPGERVDFCVPSGNFGNILAGYYAKRMGLPVGRLLCASNKNKVLTDFLTTGVYQADRPFYKTSSPSMDILISSNLERLLFEISGRDDARTAARMDSLSKTGRYEVTPPELAALKELFYAGYAGEEAVFDTISGYFDETGYVLDPHTAVAMAVFKAYETQKAGNNQTVVLSTASPYKFAADVLRALGEPVPADDFKALAALEDATALPVPDALSALRTKPARHTAVIDREGAADFVLGYAAERGQIVG